MTNTTDLAIADLPDLTQKQFNFVQGILAGKSASESYRNAYDVSADCDDTTIWTNSAQLKANTKVTQWINAAREHGLTDAIMTKEAYIRELWSDRQRLVKSGNDAVALRALELAGKVMGHYVDKSEVDVNVNIQRIERVIVDHLPGRTVNTTAETVSDTDKLPTDKPTTQ